MKKTINAQEIFLLERYISAQYFGELRDTWAGMVKHLENCLSSFMQNLPKDYRARPLPEQPDVVWGNRVMPNFRNTLQDLNAGFILLTHGDFEGLTHARGPQGDFKGQMDYWSGWMVQSDENIYGELLNKAVTLAGNISRTERGGWGPFDLVEYGDYLGPLNPPAQWPRYRVQKDVSVATGQKLEKNGIYMPDVAGSCSEFLSLRYGTAPAAKVHVGLRPILHPTTGEKYAEEPILEDQNCIWYLVERVLGQQDDVQNESASQLQHIRIPAGTDCPETGFYFTPAEIGSRRLFQKGELMPNVESAYGRTIWQWDINQSS